MNDYTTLLIATGRMEDRLREADRVRLATIAARHAPDHRSAVQRLLRWAGVHGAAEARPVPPLSTEPRPC